MENTPIIGTSEDISRISEDMNPNSYDSMMKYFDKGRGFAIPHLEFHRDTTNHIIRII